MQLTYKSWPRKHRCVRKANGQRNIRSFVQCQKFTDGRRMFLRTSSASQIIMWIQLPVCLFETHWQFVEWPIWWRREEVFAMRSIFRCCATVILFLSNLYCFPGLNVDVFKNARRRSQQHKRLSMEDTGPQVERVHRSACFFAFVTMFIMFWSFLNRQRLPFWCKKNSRDSIFLDKLDLRCESISNM